MKSKYYSLSKILAKKAMYNVIIGERSNGKTYACLKYGLMKFCQSGEQMAIVRRWQDDFKSNRASHMFDALVSNDEILKMTNGKWTDIHYYNMRWFLCRYDDKQTRILDNTPFCYAFAISAMEHDKSTSYPHITTILFDEFITRGYYLPDEFILFMNVLSTIIRERNNVIIFMCGNTVSKQCLYFHEMGLTHIKEMTPGTIDVYSYGESGLSVAVELCGPRSPKGKQSDVFFSFDNPRLNMITGRGSLWEIAVYPHCPVKYKPKDILFTYFIIFSGEILQCEIVQHEDLLFTFIHRKTTPIKDPDHDFIYTPEYDPRPNHRRRITKAYTSIEKKITSFFKKETVFYQDNEIGEIVREYLMWCAKDEAG